MSSSLYRRSHDMPHSSARPPSYTSDISRVGTSKSKSSRRFSRHGGSFSAGTSRDTPQTFLEPPQPLSREQHGSSPEDSQLKVCDGCEAERTPIWNCSYCGMNICDQCRSKQPQHREGRTGPDDFPHEKANLTIVKRLKHILNPQRTQRTSNTGEYKFPYPQLISFIGQTGAVKSTLIEMLIDQQQRRHNLRGWTLPLPIAGTLANSNLPISGDVHLYNDPRTYATEYPMLYADCEGLNGGKNTPHGCAIS